LHEHITPTYKYVIQEFLNASEGVRKRRKKQRRSRRRGGQGRDREGAGGGREGGRGGNIPDFQLKIHTHESVTHTKMADSYFENLPYSVVHSFIHSFYFPSSNP
jgi:hypothetical protein